MTGMGGSLLSGIQGAARPVPIPSAVSWLTAGGLWLAATLSGVHSLAQENPFPSVALTDAIPLIDSVDRPPPTSLVAFGGRVFFNRETSYGREWWVSGGTPGAERLILDLAPGSRGSNPVGLLAMPGGVLFIADSTTGFPTGEVGRGREVWITDGTREGTRELVDALPGPADGAGLHAVWLPGASRAFFSAIGRAASSAGGGLINRIYRTNGTPEGTELYFDASALPGQKRVFRLFGRQDRLWIAVRDAVSGDEEYWTSNGMAPPVRVAGVSAAAIQFSTTAQGLVGIGPGGWAFLTLNDAEHGAEPRRLDPDGTLQLIADLNPGPTSSAARGDLIELPGGRVVFQAGPHFEFQGGVFVTDGTGAGTQMLTDRFSITGNSFPLAASNGTIAFMIGFHLDFGFEVIRTDGTPQGTFPVKDIVPGVNGTLPTLPLELKIVGGRAFFLGGDLRIWTSDGTEAGTQPIPGIPSFSYDSSMGSASAAGDGFYFLRYLDETGARGIWRSDGTEAGTTRLVAGTASPDLWPGDQLMTVAGNLVFFVGSDSELWRSDGTPAGTLGLGFEPGPSLQAAEIVQGGGSTVWTSCFDPEAFRLRLLRSDGTRPGTVAFADLGDFAEVDARDFAWVGDRLHFALSDDASSRWEPWISEGTGPGTRRLADVHPGPPGSFPREAFRFGNRVFFAADDGTHGVELWYYEGNGVPRLFADLAPNGDFHPRDFVSLQGKFLFTGIGGPGTRRILWISDGTPEGTKPVPCAADEPRDLTPFQGAVLFSAWDGESGREIWRSDGTADGTLPVADIYPGPGVTASSNPSHLTVVGNRLFFAATDGVHGTEPWVTDGSAAGTRLVRDILPGPAGSEPSAFAAAVGRVAFVALDAEHGREVWISDGSSQGTVMTEDFAPGPLDGTTGRIVATPAGLFWFARHPDERRHRLRFTALPSG